MPLPTFARLPSGLVVNLASITRAEPNEQGGQATVVLYFSNGDTTVLSPEDAAALARHFPSGLVPSSNVRTAIFWCTILVTLILVWLAITTSGGVRH